MIAVVKLVLKLEAMGRMQMWRRRIKKMKIVLSSKM
jgi:hypothetical protein